MRTFRQGPLARAIEAMVIVFGIVLSAAAQTIATGTIEGVVTDPTGGVLPGVAVVVRHIDTNVSRELVTDDGGRYRAVALRPGRYEVTAALAGFEARPRSDIDVVVGQTAPVDIRMRPAGVAETVTVIAAAPVVDTRRTDVSNVISENAIQNLPINGRRWENFVLLSPGVTNDGGFGLVSYRGISGLYNNNMVDGVDNNQAFFSEARGRTRAVYTISQAAIKEFQVGVSSMSAEFGRAAGGTVNAVTRSGTNQFHGEGFYFLRDDAFQAREPFQPDKPDERRQQFGASVGGPIKKDTIFFFANYDQQKRTFPYFVTTSSSSFFNACAAPAANCAATRAFVESLSTFVPRKGNNKIGLGKVDWAINRANNLSVSYNGHRWNSPNGIRTAPIQFNAESDNGTDVVTTDFGVASLNTLLGEHWLNELRFQAGRDYEEQTPNAPPPGTSVTGGTSFGRPNFLPRPAFPHEQRYQFIDSVSWFRGAHSVKAGVDLNYVRDLQINLFNGGGVYSYANFGVLATDCPPGASGCAPVADGPRTGRHYTSYQQAFDLNNLDGKVFFTTWDYNGYVQDTWQASDRVVVNLGLRYEYQRLPQPGDVETDGVVFAGNPAFPETRRFEKDTNNWGPRVGVSYDVGARHRTVIRGAYGVFYGRTSNSAVSSALTNNGVSVANFFFTPTTGGAPAYPNTFTAPPSAPGSRPDIQIFSPDLERPTIQMADASVEHRIWRDVTVSGSYLFSRGTKLPFFRDTNLPTAGGQVTYLLDGQRVGTFPLYRGPRPNGSVGRIIMLDSVVRSTYHAMVLAANKRFSDGLLFNVNYTLARAEDNGQNSNTFFGGNQAYDALDRSVADRTTASDLDRRHRFVASAHYAPAYLFGVGVGGIVTLESGLPTSANISGSLSGAVGATNSASTNGSGGASFAPWLGRNSERQPERKTFDLRISKRTAVAGGAKLEVLWEIFNVFNTTNFTSVSSTAFRVASSAFDAAANTATVTLTRDPGFLVPRSASNTLWGPRDMQLGLKVLW